MARLIVKVGFETSGELVDDVWVTTIEERACKGDVLNESRSVLSSDQVNGEVRLSKRLSIVANAATFGDITRIKYVEWMGVLWTVPTVEVERPRLILSLGGVYNGPKSPTRT